MFAYLYWDPSPYVFNFSLPLLHRPVLWYGVLFALGFFVGYFFFKSQLFIYLSTRPYVSEDDIISVKSIAQKIKEGQEDKKSLFTLPLSKTALNAKNELSIYLNTLIDHFSSHKSLTKQIDKKRIYPHLSSLEQGKLMARIALEKYLGPALMPLSKKTVLIAEKVSFASIIGAVVGARLFDVIFYQNFSFIIHDPLLVFRIWEGGLASHGGALGVIVAFFIVAAKLKETKLGLSTLRILDLASIPAAFAGAMIRLGNFMNQEILGTTTTVPWAVVFGHPADHSAPMPRHPVQLYEMIAYILLFAFLLIRWKRYFRLKVAGRVIGFLLTAIFSLRFILEFFKTEQSEYLTSASLITMGQILSLPFIIIGLYLMCRKKQESP